MSIATCRVFVVKALLHPAYMSHCLHGSLTDRAATILRFPLGERGRLAEPIGVISLPHRQQDRLAVLMFAAVSVVPLQTLFVSQDTQTGLRRDRPRGQLIGSEIVDHGVRRFADRGIAIAAGQLVTTGVFGGVNLNVNHARIGQTIAHPLPNGFRVGCGDVIQDRRRDHGVERPGKKFKLTHVAKLGAHPIGNLILARPLGDPGQPPVAQIDRCDVVAR